MQEALGRGAGKNKAPTARYVGSPFFAIILDSWSFIEGLYAFILFKDELMMVDDVCEVGGELR